MSAMPSLCVTVPGAGPCRVAFRGTGAMARLLIGRNAADAPAMVATIYAICSQAQAAAARLAIGETPDMAARHAVAAEIIREHALRVLLDWPQLAGDAVEAEPAMRINLLSRDAARLAELSGFAAQAVFGMTAAQWLDLPIEQMVDWIYRGQTAAARTLAAAINCERGLPLAPEASALAQRHADHIFVANCLPGTLVQFFLSRLVDLARVCLSRDAPIADAGPRGVGRIWCSRGMLEHRAVIDGSMIADYAISAPTDRQFADGGPARRWLAQIPEMAAEKRLDRANWMMQALDPCVEFRCTMASREDA